MMIMRHCSLHSISFNTPTPRQESRTVQRQKTTNKLHYQLNGPLWCFIIDSIDLRLCSLAEIDAVGWIMCASQSAFWHNKYPQQLFVLTVPPFFDIIYSIIDLDKRWHHCFVVFGSTHTHTHTPNTYIRTQLVHVLDSTELVFGDLYSCMPHISFTCVYFTKTQNCKFPLNCNMSTN